MIKGEILIMKAWLFFVIVGVIVEILLGVCQMEIGEMVTKSGKKVMAYRLRYDNDLAMWAAVASGVLSVTTFVKYCVTIPSFFIAKLGILVLMVLGIVVAVGVFFAIAMIAVMITTSIYNTCGYVRIDY